MTKWLLRQAGALAVVVVIAVLLADAATEGDGLTVADQPIWSWLIHHRTGSMTAVLRAITQVGSTVSMALVAAVVVVGLASRPGRMSEALLVAIVGIGAGALIAYLKSSIGRVRPPVHDRLVLETNPSFPSGHALASAAIIGVLAILYLPRLANQRLRRTLEVSAVGLVGLIGLSRTYLGVHWATDLIGGWLIGGGWLIVCLSVRRLCLVHDGSRAAPQPSQD